MSQERTLYESESHRTIPEVIAFLNQLAGWLDNRQLAFGEGDETTIVELPHDVTLEIEIEEEDLDDNQVQRSLEIEITWTEDRPGPSAAGEEE